MNSSVKSNFYRDLVECTIETLLEICSEESPLCIAAKNGQTESVKVLIREESNLEDHGSSALCKAASKGHVEVVKILVEAGVVTTRRAFLEAVRKGHLETIKYLLRKRETDFVPNETSENNLSRAFGDAPLIIASSLGYPRIAAVLLEAGADVHVDCDLPLRNAVRNRHPKVVKTLLKAGANLHAEEDFVLHHVLETKDSQIASQIVAHRGETLGDFRPRLISMILKSPSGRELFRMSTEWQRKIFFDVLLLLLRLYYRPRAQLLAILST